MRSVVRSRLRHLKATSGTPGVPAKDHVGADKLAYSVAQFAEASDLSRSLLYEAIKLGELQSIKVRGRRLILTEDGKTWLLSFRRGRGPPVVSE
jgi:hypothetical protein